MSRFARSMTCMHDPILHLRPSANERGPTGDEDSSSASPQDARFEKRLGLIIGPAVPAGSRDAWRRRYGNTRRREIRGTPEIGRPVSRKARKPGKPGNRQAGDAGRCAIQGNLENHRQAGWRVKMRGNPKLRCWCRGRNEDSGRPEDSPSELPERRGLGATRGFDRRRC